jgi:SAM-dependent methyltransferase
MVTEKRNEAGATVDDAAQAMFNRQLATYRKITRENLMYHREVYDILRGVLIAEAPVPFRFLDVACGDASASAAMLQGTAIAYYHGIDLSALSLQIAGETLRSLPCPVDLHCRDFVEALGTWAAPIDIVWIGMSLHHLQSAGKRRLMEDVRSALGEPGIFLIWEPTYLDGEDRTAWLDRFSTLRPQWAVLSDEEFAEMESHMLAADFPETAEGWKTMGLQAGFGRAAEVFVMPNRMGRVFKFWH